MTKECVTHHYACACREEQFATLRAKLQIAIAALKKISTRGAGPLQHRLEVDEALKEIEGIAGGGDNG